MTAQPLTPNELARERDVRPVTIRNYLRSKYGVLASRHETRWQLDAEQAANVHREFGSRSGK